MEAKVGELARRICLAQHEPLASRPLPCPIHITRATQLWGLVGPTEQATLTALLDYAEELGLRKPPTGDPLARHVIEDGIEAMRLTREYVGEAMLPETPGWSWYDWTVQAKAVLEADPGAALPGFLSIGHPAGRDADALPVLIDDLLGGAAQRAPDA